MCARMCMCVGGASPGMGGAFAILTMRLILRPSRSAILTGQEIWQSGEVKDGAQYSSVIPIEHGGKRQYVQLFQKTLAGVAAAQISFTRRPQLYAGGRAPPPSSPRLTLVVLCIEGNESSSAQVCGLCE